MKLHEFTDRFYAMGGIDQEEKKNRRLTEDLNDIISVTVDFNSDEDDYEVINYIKQKYNIDVVDYDPTDYIENATLRGTKSNIIKYLATEYQGYDSEEEGIDWVEEFYPELFDESLIEARNPENDEVNAVLRKWANRSGNRLGKKDQKILDDAGIEFENMYDSGNEKVAKIKGGKNYLGKWTVPLKNNDKFDAVNYLKTDRPPRYDTTSYESEKLLRPYSIDYNLEKHFADYFSGRRQQFKDEGNDKLEKEYDNRVKEQEKKMSDIVAKAKAKHPQYESLNLNESKQGLVDYFNELMSTFGVKPYDQIDYLLGYMSESELLDAIDNFKEYMDIDDEDIM